ncbi:MAG: hypothetical protein GQ557_01720 [Mycoplasmataceae bacterium]|nr:hypothetical protein [Mycoplasmataceae bacterium]
MEITLKIFNQKISLNSLNNIIPIYGKNNSGKTMTANEVFNYVKKHQKDLFIFKNQSVEKVYLIDENLDLKKEFGLAKSSNLRKEILSSLIKEIEKLNHDFIDHNLRNTEINDLIHNLTNNQFINSDLPFNFIFENKINDATDIIDNLLNVKILNDQNEEINLIKTSSSDLIKIYLSLRINTINKTSNNIVIIDSIDNNFDENNLFWLQSVIKELSRKNLIIILSKNINFLKNFNNVLNDIYILENKLLRQISFSFSSIKKMAILNEYLKANDEYSFDYLFERADQLISRTEYDFYWKNLISTIDFTKTFAFLKLNNQDEIQQWLIQFSDLMKVFYYLFFVQNNYLVNKNIFLINNPLIKKIFEQI